MALLFNIIYAGITAFIEFLKMIKPEDVNYNHFTFIITMVLLKFLLEYM